jgi:dihydropyrimidinase
VITLIRNGAVCFEDRIQRADILVRDARIAEVGDTLSTDADHCVDAEGAFVLPGFMDIHTHLDDRIGRYALADDYLSGTRIAVENGITTLATFVTESADAMLEDALGAAQQRASGRCYTDHWWHLTPIRFDTEGWHALDRLIARGFRHVKLYTTYRPAGIFSDYDQLERIFEKLSGHGIQFLIHCEDDAALSAVHLPDDEWKRPLAHARSRPPGAEVLAIREVLRRAQQQQAAVHIVHVSTPEGLALIQDARSAVRVTCETGPQYLFLDESWLMRGDGHRWICSPPLRSPEMRKALVTMAARGAVDLFATDHCAFTRADKDACRASVREVPNGIAGIGALPHLVYSLFAGTGIDPMLEMTRRLSANPARLLGVYPRKGAIQPWADADLVICRLTASERPLRSSLAEVHESYPAMKSQLQFEHVFLRGQEVVRDGRLLNPDERRGRTLWPT